MKHAPMSPRFEGTVSYTSLLVTVILMFFTGPSWSAEKVTGKFKNVDQVIGWVKAKGACEEPSLEICSVVVELPKKGQDGKELSPGWILSGSFKTITSKDTRLLMVFINRRRKFNLSDNDKKAFVLVNKEIRYVLSPPDGEITEAMATIQIMNYKLEKFLEMAIPLSSPYMFGGLSLEESVESIILLNGGFGLEWITFPP